VRDKVVAAWTASETENRIAEKAEALFKRLQTGAALTDVASEIGKPVQTVENVKRNATVEGLSVNAASQAFAGPEGHVANAEGDGQSRVLLKVEQVTAPAFFAEAADVQSIQQQVSEALKNDLVSTYNRQLLESRPTSVNNVAFQQLTGQLQQTQ
jgi:peptidyl-prolyl cis-trans isomerase D